ncbi:MAG: TonB-dependent receptor [Sphingobacteriales bacterium]|nr:TonB-dependent receptor [Sphingobacteriales bacterium]
MKQRLILVLGAFLTVQSLMAQEDLAPVKGNGSVELPLKVTLRGKITDAKTGEPLPGAYVYFTDDKIGTSADAAGQYMLTNIPPGHHVVEISFTGYSTLVEHIGIHTDMQKDFALSPVIVENQGVIITGVSGATSIRKTPVPITAVKRATLIQTPSANIIDALSHVPGVSQLSTGPAISKPIIRGLGYNRVVTVNDGIRQEGQQWGDEHGIEIDEMSVNKVEILKGPASLMYGSDALAGVVNFITSVPAPEGTVRGNLLTNYQSNSRLTGNNMNFAGNKNGFNWNVYGSLKSAGDYKNKLDGRVLNSRFNERNAGGYLGLNKGWGYSHLIFSHFDQRVGLVEGDRDDATGKFLVFAGTPHERIAGDADLSSRKLFIPNQRVVHYKLVSENNLAIGNTRLKFNLGFQDNQRYEFGNAENPAEKSLFFDLKTYNYTLQWQLPELKEWHTTIGLNGMQQSNRNKGVEVLIPEYGLFDIGGFVYFQRFYKKATLSGGLRFDNRSVDSKAFVEGNTEKFKAFTRNFSNLSGSLGLSYEPSERVTVKANIARGFRAPTLAELASNGTHEGTNRYEYGTRDLKSETSLQLDGGIDLDYEHFSLAFSAFYNRISDFVFYRKLESVLGGDSLVNTGGDYIPAFVFNQHNATLAGLEFTFDIHPHPIHWLHFENIFSFVRGRFDRLLDGVKPGSDNLPLIPAPKWSTEIRADIKKLGKTFRNFYARFGGDKTFRQDHFFSGYDTETATNGYFLLNAGLGSDIVNHKNRTLFSLHLGMMNIGNTAWQNHLSRLKYTTENLVTGRRGVFNTGRNFSVKLNIPIEFKLK